MFDLVVRGGTVVDGSGNKSFVADVGIVGDRIVAVGADLGPGRREIDARGRIVTPGFVDIHTHFDAQATWDPQLTPSSLHGVTTAVMGSCGVGFAPAAPDRHEWLIELMEAVEDIPGSALVEGMKWGFETFPEYLNVLEAQPRILDLGAQVPHGALRAYVMGDRGANNEEATPDDIRRMYELTLQALRAGALGFSTSRTSLHKAMNGEVMPGTTAAMDEVFGIAKAIKDAGHGVFQGTVEHKDLPGEVAWMKKLSLDNGCFVSMNLSQIVQAPNLWRDGLAMMAQANADGARVVGQVAGRAIGVIMGLELTAHPLLSTQTYLEMMHDPLDERVAKLKDPATRARLIADESLDLGEFPNLITRSFERMFPANADGTIDYEPTPDRSILAIARSKGISPREAALDALMAHDGRGKMYFPLFNYADGNLDLLHTLHQDKNTRMGLSDAGAHCGAICDGGMPTFMLSFWARDRQGDKMSLEHVVHRQTRETAEMYGLMDRGLLQPGFKADVNVIDFDKLSLGPVEVKYDLPAGGRRLLQRAHGYVATICSGVVTVENDTFTGALPGRLVRGPRQVP